MTHRHDILVIDDDPAIREFLTMLFQDEGYVVRSAAEGAEGILSMCESRPDVIVLDVRMPIMDGWAFRRRQGELEGFGAIPTIIMSAASHPTRSELGSARFLEKPFTTTAMLSAVHDAIAA